MSEQDDNRKAQSEALGRALAEAMDGDRLHPDNQPQVGTMKGPKEILSELEAKHGPNWTLADAKKLIDEQPGPVPQPTPAEPRRVELWMREAVKYIMHDKRSYADPSSHYEALAQHIADCMPAEPRIETLTMKQLKKAVEKCRGDGQHNCYLGNRLAVHEIMGTRARQKAGAQPEPEERAEPWNRRGWWESPDGNSLLVEPEALAQLARDEAKETSDAVGSVGDDNCGTADNGSVRDSGEPFLIAAQSQQTMCSADIGKMLIEQAPVATSVSGPDRARAEQWMRENKNSLPGPLTDSDWDQIRNLLAEYSSSSSAALQKELDHFAKQNLEWANCAEQWRLRVEASGMEQNLTDASFPAQVGGPLVVDLGFAIDLLSAPQGSMVANRIAHWQKRAEAAEVKVAKLERHISDVAKELDFQDEQCGRLDAKVAELQAKNDHLLRMSAAHDSTVAEFDALRDSRDRLQEQAAELQKELEIFKDAGCEWEVERVRIELDRNRLQEALRESETVVDNLAAIARRWVEAFDVYWRAWLREIGGVIVPKHHEIDGFVLRTRAVYDKAKLVDRIKKILCDELKAKSDGEKMFDAVFRFLAEDGNDKTPTN